MKRTAIKRTPMKPWRRPVADRVPPEVADAAWLRDKGCVPAQLGAPGLCRDAFRNVHAWNDRSRLTIEHVRDHAAMGAPRAKSDLAHMLWGCAGHTVQSWELAHKQQLREWLDRPVRSVAPDPDFEERWNGS